eukprot:364197-Chlamydomonas_euryale.AAC.3
MGGAFSSNCGGGAVAAVMVPATLQHVARNEGIAAMPRLRRALPRRSCHAMQGLASSCHASGELCFQGMHDVHSVANVCPSSATTVCPPKRPCARTCMM